MNDRHIKTCKRQRLTHPEEETAKYSLHKWESEARYCSVTAHISSQEFPPAGASVRKSSYVLIPPSHRLKFWVKKTSRIKQCILISILFERKRGQKMSQTVAWTSDVDAPGRTPYCQGNWKRWHWKSFCTSFYDGMGKWKSFSI